jgi:hypothetical protein
MAGLPNGKLPVGKPSDTMQKTSEYFVFVRLR